MCARKLDYVCMANGVQSGVLAALLLSALNSATAQTQRCVPAADGKWQCGKYVTEADAAPLPELQSRSLPPVMLIDPARFGEGDLATDAAPDVSATELPVAEKSNAQATKVTNQQFAAPVIEKTLTIKTPAATQTPGIQTPAASTAPAPALAQQARARRTAKPGLAAGANFSVQLALASTPRGFDALLAKLGSAARSSQRRQLANGSWVLLLGSFDSISAARNAIPGGVDGAFARDLSTLNFR